MQRGNSFSESTSSYCLHPVFVAFMEPSRKVSELSDPIISMLNEYLGFGFLFIGHDTDQPGSIHPIDFQEALGIEAHLQEVVRNPVSPFGLVGSLGIDHGIAQTNQVGHQIDPASYLKGWTIKRDLHRNDLVDGITEDCCNFEEHLQFKGRVELWFKAVDPAFQPFMDLGATAGSSCPDTLCLSLTDPSNPFLQLRLLLLAENRRDGWEALAIFGHINPAEGVLVESCKAGNL